MKKNSSLKSALMASKKTRQSQQVKGQKVAEPKVNLSIRLDLSTLNWIKIEAERLGIPYQTLINSLLKQASDQPSIEERLKKIESHIFGVKKHT